MKLSIILLPLSFGLFQCYNAMQRPVNLDSVKEVNDVGTSAKGGSDGEFVFSRLRCFKNPILLLMLMMIDPFVSRGSTHPG
jgi:hypothetical protein